MVTCLNEQMIRAGLSVHSNKSQNLTDGHVRRSLNKSSPFYQKNYELVCKQEEHKWLSICLHGLEPKVILGLPGGRSKATSLSTQEYPPATGLGGDAWNLAL